MPRRRHTPAKEAPASREPHKRQAAAVLAERHRLMIEIASLHTSGRRSQFTANAEELLTRWWASASWSARRQLLKTVGWLLHLEKSRKPNEPGVAGASAGDKGAAVL